MSFARSLIVPLKTFTTAIWQSKLRLTLALALLLAASAGTAMQLATRAFSSNPQEKTANVDTPGSTAVKRVVKLQEGERSKPYAKLRDGHVMSMQYVGDERSRALLAAGAESRALATTDLDMDGAPDLIAGYAANGVGIVTVQRGNIEAYAPKDDASFVRMQQGYNPDPVLPIAETFEVPEAVDYIATGDFNGDGLKDVAVGARHGGLYLLAGNGNARLSPAQRIELWGTVTGLAAGELNLPDGRTELAVAVTGSGRSALEIYEGSSGELRSIGTYDLAGEAVAIQFGQLDDDPFGDLAVAAGQEILIVHGLPGGGPLKGRAERLSMPFGTRGLAIGNFVWDREARAELAVLDDDGNVHVLEQGGIDKRTFSEEDLRARRASRDLPRIKHEPDHWLFVPRWEAGKAKKWSQPRIFGMKRVNAAGVISQGRLVRANIARQETEEVLVVDSGQKKVNLVREQRVTAAAAGKRTMAESVSATDDITTDSLEMSETPAAVLGMPSKVNGFSDLVMLASTSPGPVIVSAHADTTITVDRFDDSAAAAAAVCDDAIANDCSLRGAVAHANTVSGSTINIPAGTYQLTIPAGSIEFGGANICSHPEAGDLDINLNTTLMGAGAATTIIQQTTPEDRVLCLNPNVIAGREYTISGVTVTGGREVSKYGGAGLVGGAVSDVTNISSAIFTDNRAFDSGACGTCSDFGSGGGAIKIEGGNLNITNCTIGADNLPASPPSTAGTDITLSNSGGSGGGVNYSPGAPIGGAGVGNLNMTDTTVKNNTAFSIASGGGGIDLFQHNLGTGVFTIGTSTITGNRATGGGTPNVGGGGGIIVETGPLTINNGVSITNNIANGNGGGMQITGGSVDFNSTGGAITFSGNTANAAGAVGSGIAANSNVSVTGTLLSITNDVDVQDNCTWTNNAGSSVAITNLRLADISAGGNVGTYTANNSATNLTGNLTVAGGLYSANTGTANIGGNLSITSGTFNNGTTTDLTGNFSLSSGTFNGSSGAVNISGNFTFSSGAFNANTSTFTFNGAGAQSINGPSSPTFNNLTKTGAGTLTLFVNSPIAGNLNVSAGTFDLSTFTANRTAAGGTLTVANGATLKIGGTGTLPSNFSTHSIGATSTIEYFGTNQNVATLNSAQRYGHLTTSGSGTKTLAGAIGISGNLTIGSGTTLDVSASNFGISFTGADWINNGTFNPRSGTVTFDPTSGTQLLVGNTTFFNLTLQNTGATTNFGTTTTTVGNDLVATAGIMDGGLSTLIFTGVTDNLGSIGGASEKNLHNLQINSPASISNSTGGNTTIENNFTNSGTFTQAAGLTTIFGTDNNGDGLHSFSGNGSTTFGNVTINGSNTVDAGSHNFNVAGASFDVTGTFTGNTSTVTFNGAVAQTIQGNGAKDFSGLTINNANGVTLNNGTGTVDASVGGLLTLTTDLTVAAGAILQQSGTSAGGADVIGTVRRTDLGVTERAFGNPFNTITIDSGTAPNPMDVTLVKTAPPDFTTAVTRTYTLTPTGGSGISATLQLHYLDSELNGNTEAKLALWRKNGAWTAQGRTGAVDTVNKAVTLAGVESFSDWTLAAVDPPTISKAFADATIPLNGTTTVSFTITNPNTLTDLSGVSFTDNLPAGLVVADVPNVVGVCGGTVTAVAGAGTISLSGGTIAAGANCEISVDVKGTTAGVKDNTTDAPSSTEGGTGVASNTATVTVLAPPTISKAFGAGSVPLNGTTTVTFTLTNPNSANGLTGVAFNDNLPAGLVVDDTPGVVNNCGTGTVTANAGASLISYSGGSLTASQSCTIVVNVKGTTAGSKSNTTDAITSTEGGTGATSNTAVLAVVAPPVIAKAFDPTGTTQGGLSTLTFTITNPADNTVALTGVAFTDNLPAGIKVAAAPNPQPAVDPCGTGSTLTATANSGQIILAGGMIAAGGMCTFSVDVTATTGGLNEVQVTSTNGGTGNTATATLTTCVAPPANLVAWWTGDNTTRDIAGGSDGTLNGDATYGAGKVLNGFSLDGTGDFVEAPDSNSLDLTTAITIDAWINPTNANTTARIVDKITPGNTDGYLFDLNAGKLRFISGTATAESLGTIPAGTLTHVAVTYDGANISFYIDGVLDSTTAATGAIPVNALPLRIGAAQDGTFGFAGVIDEVEIFSVALTAAELQGIHDAGAGGKCKPADLRIEKTHTDPFVQGSAGNTYTITVTNDGPGATSGTTTVTENLPAGLTATGLSGTGWTCSDPLPAEGPATLTCTSTDAILAGDDFPVLTLTVTAGVNMASVTNNVEVANGAELDTSDNSDDDVTNLTPSADLAVLKTDAPDPVTASQDITYSVTLTNNGPSDAQTVTLTDAVPANTTFVSAVQNTGPTFTCTTPLAGGTGNVSCSIATLATGVSATFTIVVKVNAATAEGTVISNDAVAASATGDPTPGNNTGTATTTVRQSDIEITSKTDAPDPVTAGENITYTINFQNNSAFNPASDVTVTDTVPAGTTLVSATTAAAGWARTDLLNAGDTGDVVFAKATVAASETAVFTIVVQVNANVAAGTDTITNTATAATTSIDTNSGNNSATATTSTATSADLEITSKTDTPEPVIASSNITYAINFINNGPSDAQTVTVTDAVPANTTFVSATAAAGWTIQSQPAVGATGDVVFAKGTVAAAETAVFEVVVKVNANAVEGSTITNDAVAASATTDPTPGNNTGSATTTVNQSDIEITSKTDAPDPVTSGENITYTINFQNNSAVTSASTVTVTDTVPAGTTFVSATVTTGSEWSTTSPAVGATGDVVFAKETVAASETAVFTIVVKVNANVAAGTDTITNTATAATTSIDTNSGNNSATATTSTVTSADLEITSKTDAPDPVIAGENITYTISFRNNGPSDAQTVTVTDAVPVNTTFVSATITTGAGWTIQSQPSAGATGDVVFAKGTVAAGETATLTVVVKVNSNTAATTVITNEAVAASATSDPTPGNNTGTATTTVVTSADLLVVKVDSPDPVAAGSNLTYTITVTNGGSSDAQSLSLSDTLPGFTTLVSFTVPAGWTRTDAVPAGGTGTVTATSATLASGDNAVFTLVVHVDINTPHNTVLSNSATVSTTTTDPNPANNTGTALTTVVALPDANDDQYFGLQETVLNVPAPGVLSNDTGPNLVVTPIVNGATSAGGTVNLSADGGFSYTPPAGFSGTDSFNYTVTNVAGSDSAKVEITVTDPATIALIISEFRLNGPNGATDEFIEIFNSSPTAHQVGGTGASNNGGYGVFASAGNGTTSDTITLVCAIPNGTVIPARGHVLCTNSGYSLADLGVAAATTGGPALPPIAGAAATAVGNFPIINGTVAHPGAFTSVDIPNDAGLMLANVGANAVVTTADTASNFGFAATGVANFKVYDRIGFAPYGAGAPLQPGCHLTSGQCGPAGNARPLLADNFCEGGAAGCLKPVGDASIAPHGGTPFYGDSGQYSLLRRQANFSVADGTLPRDTGNNADDLLMVAPLPGVNIAAGITGVTGLVSVLGAAGPQNNAAPPDLPESKLESSLFDPARGAFQGPNAERIWVIDVSNTTMENNPQGTLLLRFGFENISGATLNWLRFRIDNLGVPCGAPSPSSGTAVTGSGQARNLNQAAPNCQGSETQTAVVKALNMNTQLLAKENAPPEIVRGSVIEDTAAATNTAPNGGGINNSLVRTGIAPGSNTGEFGVSVGTTAGTGRKFYLTLRLGIVKSGFMRFLLQQEASSATPLPNPTVTP